MHVIELSVGDQRGDPEFDLRDKFSGEPGDAETWEKLDISAGTTTVVMRIKKVGSTAAATAVTCTKTGTYTFKLPLASAPFSTKGDYDGQIIVTIGGQQQAIIDKVLFRVFETL